MYMLKSFKVKKNCFEYKVHTCAHPLIVDCIHGWDLHDTIEQLDQHTQINRQNGSFDTFEVLVLHTHRYHRAPLFHDQFQKYSNDVSYLFFYEGDIARRMIVKI